MAFWPYVMICFQTCMVIQPQQSFPTKEDCAPALVEHVKDFQSGSTYARAKAEYGDGLREYAACLERPADYKHNPADVGPELDGTKFKDTQ